MKITKKSILQLVENKIVRGNLVNQCVKDKNESDVYGVKFLSDVMIHNLIIDSTRILVLSSKVKNLIDKCKVNVDKDFRVDVLRTLPNRYDTIQVDEKTCIKYHKTDGTIYVQTFRIDRNLDDLLVSEFLVSTIRENEYITSKLGVNNDDLDLFLRVVTFLELTDVSLNILYPNQSLGNIMKGDYIKNETKSKVIYVNSNWNVGTIRIGTIDVCGHFRLQPYGNTENRYYKYIFIEPYQKGLIRRLPQKELV